MATAKTAMLTLHYNYSNGSWARGFAALWVVPVMGLGLMTSPAEAEPFAYVTNQADNTVSVIDTASYTVVGTPIPVGTKPIGVTITPDGKYSYVANDNSSNVSVIATASNSVVATVPVASGAYWVAVTPDGKHAYVTNLNSNNVSVIATASNTVVGTPILVGTSPFGVTITPDGKHAYVVNRDSNNVSVIATARNIVVATVPVGTGPRGVAITPNGKHAYVVNANSQNVSVINTARNIVVATVPVAGVPYGVAITPDGKHAYVTNNSSKSVSVIATASKTVVGTPIPVGTLPIGVAITPDGKHAYVANIRSELIRGNVSVIDTATNKVVATVAVGNAPTGVGIIPPPPGVPFLAFGAALRIAFGGGSNQDAFDFHSHFTLSSIDSNGINPPVEQVKVQIGTFSTIIPPSSFMKRLDGSFTFRGVIHEVIIQARIRPTGTLRYATAVLARGANLAGTKNPIQVALTIGDDSGTTSVSATNLEVASE